MKAKFYQTDQELKDRMFKKFVHNIPGNLDFAIDNELSFESKKLSNAMDYFEFHYRHYLSGMHQTLHRVMHEFRYLKSSRAFDKEIVVSILKLIENDILDTELYELMPRHIKAKKRVLKELLIQKKTQYEQ